MAFSTTFRHSSTPQVRGRELDANLDALGVYVDATFLPLAGGAVSWTGTLTGTWDGWIGSGETWTYASATTFTISGDLTGKYQKGDKIKLTQTTAKYFYVTAVAHAAGTTTVTVTGGTDYTLANAAITSPFYSKMQTPQDFPQWFAYTPAWTATGTQPAIGNGTLTGRFIINGKNVVCTLKVLAGNTTTFGTGVYRLSLPVAISATLTSTANGLTLGTWVGIDTGVQTFAGVVAVSSFASPGTLTFFAHSAATDGLVANEWGATSLWTFGNTDLATATVTYEI